MSLPQEACALIQTFSELAPGVPASEETLKDMLAYFFQPRQLEVRPEPDLLIEIEGHRHFKRKRDGSTELTEEYVGLYLFKLKPPVSHGYRPRRVLYYGHVKKQDDVDGFLKHLTECRRIVSAVRAGGMCACGERLKLKNARLCADCAVREFLQ